MITCREQWPQWLLSLQRSPRGRRAFQVTVAENSGPFVGHLDGLMKRNARHLFQVPHPRSMQLRCARSDTLGSCPSAELCPLASPPALCQHAPFTHSIYSGASFRLIFGVVGALAFAQTGQQGDGWGRAQADASACLLRRTTFRSPEHLDRLSPLPARHVPLRRPSDDRQCAVARCALPVPGLPRARLGGIFGPEAERTRGRLDHHRHEWTGAGADGAAHRERRQPWRETASRSGGRGTRRAPTSAEADAVAGPPSARPPPTRSRSDLPRTFAELEEEYGPLHVRCDVAGGMSGWSWASCATSTIAARPSAVRCAAMRASSSAIPRLNAARRTIASIRSPVRRAIVRLSSG